MVCICVSVMYYYVSVHVCVMVTVCVSIAFHYISILRGAGEEAVLNKGIGK